MLDGYNTYFLSVFKSYYVYATLIPFILITIFVLQLYVKKNCIKRTILLEIFLCVITFISWMLFDIHGNQEAYWIFKILCASCLFTLAILINQLIEKYIWQAIFTKGDICLVPDFLKSVINIFVYIFIMMVSVDVIFKPSKYYFSILFIAALFFLLIYMGQNQVSSLIAAFSLSLTPSFRKGDTIIYKGDCFTVENINWRFVTLVDNNNNRTFVPNSIITNEEVLNFTIRDTKCQIDVNIQTTIDAQPYYIIELLSRELLYLPQCDHTQELNIYVTDMKGYLNFNINFPVHNVVDCEDFMDVTSGVYARVWDIFKDNNIPLYIQPVEIREHTKHDIRPKLPETDKLKSIFRNTLLFKDFDDKNIETILKKAHVHYFKPFKKILTFGQHSRSLYIIVYGSVLVSIPDSAFSSLEIKTLSKGDFFGGLSLLTGKNSTADITAKTNVIVYAINFETMQSILKEHPEYVQKLAARASELEMENIEKYQNYTKQKESQKRLHKTYEKSLIGKIRQYFDVGL